MPYKGITTARYPLPVPTNDKTSYGSSYTSFFSLIGAPSDCVFEEGFGYPHELWATTALTETTKFVSSVLAPSTEKHNTGPFQLESVTGALTPSESSAQRPITRSSTFTEGPGSPPPVPVVSPQKTGGSVAQPGNAGTYSAPPEITIGGFVVSPKEDSVYIVASQTLKPGGQISVSGTPISLVPSATAMVVAGVTEPIQPAVYPTLAAITVNGSPITPNAASEYIVGSQTLIRGAPAITISGTPYSIAPLTTYSVLGDTGHQIGPCQPNLPTQTIDGIIVTPNAAGDYIVGSKTLIPGAPAITISGTPYSIAPITPYFVLGGTGSHIGPYQPNLPTPTIGGILITPNAASDYIVGSQTLIPGGSAITISGTPYSLASGDSYLVVGSITETFTTQTGAPGLGGYIISGLGGPPTVTGSGGGGANITVFTGGTMKLGSYHKAVAAGALVLAITFYMMW